MTRKGWISLVVGSVVAAILAYIVVGLLDSTKTYTQPSESMEPTIGAGEKISVDESAYDDADPEINDIVVFHPPLGATGKGPQCGSPPPKGAACADPTPR